MTLKEKEMPEEWDRDGRGAVMSVQNLRAFNNNIFILSSHSEEVAEQMEEALLSDWLSNSAEKEISVSWH